MTTLPTAIVVFGVHVILTALPVVAALLVAMTFGVKDRLLLLSAALSGLLITGYLTFWIFWASASAGRIFTILLTPALVILVVCLGARRRRDLKLVGLEFLRPSLLWVASSLLIFSFGATYPSSHVLTTTAQSRFLPALPIDNQVPLIVAHALQASHRPIPHPLYVIWDSSDRPPLQTGVYLSEEALLPGGDPQAVHYVVVGVLLQGLWIFGIWGLLASVRARRRLAGLVLTAILFSGFVLVNTFFTWPKLFAATYLVLLAAILFTPSFTRLRASGFAGAIAGALAGAALLGHEGSGLALLAYIIVMVVQRRKPSRRFVLGAAAVLLVTQGSWMVYQKVIDPPGDQLARLQIANQVHLPGDRRPLLTVIVATYEKTPFGTIVVDKVSNLVTPFEGVSTYVVNTTRLLEGYVLGKSGTMSQQAAARQLIGLNFFELVPSVGFLSFGFFAWAACSVRDRRRRQPPVMRLANTIWLVLVVNIVTWAIVLFGPSATVIHQGSYITELLAFTACVIGLWALSSRLCVALVLFQASLAVILYGFNGVPNNVHHHLRGDMLALTIVALVATTATLWLIASKDPRHHGDAVRGGREWRTTRPRSISVESSDQSGERRLETLSTNETGSP